MSVKLAGPVEPSAEVPTTDAVVPATPVASAPEPAPVVAAAPPVASEPSPEPTLMGFQVIGSLIGLSNDVCIKLPVDWPANRAAVSIALRSAGCPVAELTGLMKQVEEYRETAPAPAPVAATPVAAAPAPTVYVASVLPDAPGYESLLGKFEMGANLIVNEDVIFAAIVASMAYDEAGPNLADLPKRILKMMEDYAEGLDIAVGASYMDLYKEVTTRRNADVAAMLGIPGAFATQERKRELLGRMNEYFWPELRSFNTRLVDWVKAWQTGSASMGMNMGALIQFIANLRVGGAVPPGITSNPETGAIEDAAKGVIRIINRTFSGVRSMTARALGFEATKIRALIDQPELAMNIGANGNRDMMLKMLGVDVSPDAVRLERDVVKYALAVWRLPQVSSGETMLNYLSSLFMLGSTISWDKLPDKNVGAPRKEVPSGPVDSRFRRG